MAKFQAPNHKLQMVRQANHPEPVEGQYPMTKIQNYNLAEMSDAV